MKLDRERMGWSAAELPLALATVARRYRLPAVEAAGDVALDAAEPDRWIVHRAARLGLEAVALQERYRRLRACLAQCAPVVIRIGAPGESWFVVAMAGSYRTLTVLTPKLETVRVRAADVHAALIRPQAGEAHAEIVPLLEGVPARRRAQAGARLVRERLGEQHIVLGWMLRPAACNGLRLWASEHALWGPGLGLLAGHAAWAMLWVLSWWWLAQGAFSGNLDSGRVGGWGLLIASAFLARLAAGGASELVAVRLGALLKRRLLEGALRLEGEEVRAFGIGQFLGRVTEGETLEHAATSGGLLGVVALIDLALAGLVMAAAGPTGLVLAALMAGWIVATLLLAVRYFRARRRWTQARLGLTGALVETMVGHRTRLVQGFEMRERRREDIAVEDYLRLSQRVDHASAWLQTVVPRGWLLSAILGLAPGMAAGTVPVTALALALGGILLAYYALHEFADGLERVVDGAAAWSWIRPFWSAAERPAALGETRYATAPAASASARPRIEAHNLCFRHARRGGSVLDGVDFSVRDGDRVLLSGPSGAGKSTLASLLAGLRVPQSGLVLLDGLDLASRGEEAWRRRVLVVPQFHENHVLMGTLAFNLLLGRCWPADSSALEEAEEVCRELGLGPMLQRMPGGLNQVVGETGWQLSHGERDRVFLARALLQRPQVLILDESLAALDPRTLRQVFATVAERAPTLLLIAHP